MALVPLVWMGGLTVRGYIRGWEWWWLAIAFGVSWLADTAALVADPWIISAVYPLGQSALVGLVFLTRRDGLRFLMALLAVGVAAMLWRGAAGPEVLLRTVAWGAVVGIVLDRWALGRLRTTLLVYFGLGLFAWWLYALSPGWWTWGAYQFLRLAGILLFCAAALKPGPALRVEAA